jgi:hypothetical protein
MKHNTNFCAYFIKYVLKITMFRTNITEKVEIYYIFFIEYTFSVSPVVSG